MKQRWPARAARRARAAHRRWAPSVDRSVSRLRNLHGLRPLTRRETRDVACYVATYHKTGTLWMNRLFSMVAWRLMIPFVPQRREWTADELSLPWTDVTRRRRVVALEWSTARTAGITAEDRFRAARVIRDPRDQLISSTHYHARAREAWLHVPKRAFEGRTYQEMLCSKPTLREQVLFEMGRSSRPVIEQMVAFDDSAPNLRTIRYEQLMTRGLAEFRSLFEFLGFRGGALEVALECAAQESLGSNPGVSRRSQVRSGAVEQWRGVFDQELAGSFLAVHPTALVALGYEDSDDWIATLPRYRPELDAVAASPSRTMEVPA